MDRTDTPPAQNVPPALSLPPGGAVLVVVACAGGILGHMLTGRKTSLFVEDGLVEWSSAVIYAIAAGMAALILFARRASAADRPVLVGIAGLAALCYLSEISFGARIGHFSMPAMPGGGELDGPHDFVVLAKRFVESAVPGHTALKVATIALAGIVAALVALRLGLVQRMRYWTSQSATRLWASIAGLALIAAVGLDTFEQSWSVPFEELSELFAAFALAAAAIAGDRPARSSPDG